VIEDFEALFFGSIEIEEHEVGRLGVEHCAPLSSPSPASTFRNSPCAD